MKITFYISNISYLFRGVLQPNDTLVIIVEVSPIQLFYHKFVRNIFLIDRITLP